MRQLLLVFLALLPIASLADPTFPVLSGRVVDDAGMLSSSAEDRIVALSTAHEKASTNQVVVATLLTCRVTQSKSLAISWDAPGVLARKPKTTVYC